jgi:hypothetical protein
VAAPLRALAAAADAAPPASPRGAASVGAAATPFAALLREHFQRKARALCALCDAWEAEDVGGVGRVSAAAADARALLRPLLPPEHAPPDAAAAGEAPGAPPATGGEPRRAA